MAIKLKLGRNDAATGARHAFRYRILRAALVIVVVCFAAGAVVFGILYFKYKKIVDDRLAAGPIFANTSQIYAAPREVRVGQRLTVSFIAQDLRNAGYNSNPRLGTFT